MSTRYRQFCHVDSLFYDIAPPADDHSTFEAGGRATPPGWRRAASGDWVMYSPTPGDLPAQGWKIHVSGCADNAERILELVWDCCMSLRLAFKFLNSERTLLARNAKESLPSRSGKFVTIYPRDETELELACNELDERLRGQPGPYIAGDLRWGQGPVYVRFGGFLPMQVRTASGRVVLAIREDTGRLVPDDRSPLFTLPPWVPVPRCLVPHLQTHNAATCSPYRIVKVLRLLNGGGIYVGEHNTTGERVIVKEARRHAGLDAAGMDAITRLRHEHITLRRLADISAVPRVIDLFGTDERLFLVMELVDGTRLERELARRSPILAPDLAGTRDATFVQWAMAVHHRVQDAIAAIHRRGVVFANLHPHNVVVRADGDVVLVDYELAFNAQDGQYGSGDRASGAVDDHALACFLLNLFVPLPGLCELAPYKAGELAEVIRNRFSVPQSWLDEATKTIAATGAHQQPPRSWSTLLAQGWVAVRDALTRAIQASATPARRDRLVPGDPAQFATVAIDIAHGAAGVLYALSVTGAGRRPDLEQWLVERATKPGSAHRLGFYDGLHGVAYVLHHLGHRRLAVELLAERCLTAPCENVGNDLHSGLTGIALNLIHFAKETGEEALHDLATQAAELVAGRLGRVDGIAQFSGSGHPCTGLMRGASGPALLFIRLYEDTGETSWLDHAALALHQDLSHTTTHLATGSTGIGLVLDRYLSHRPNERFAAASETIHAAARSWFCAQSGLFTGRASLIYYLAQRTQTEHRTARSDLANQIRQLSWHGIAYADGMAFAGDQLLRLSMDLATGTAGVLLALGAALHGGQAHLPFLDAPRSTDPGT